jgi:hypothetical protein
LLSSGVATFSDWVLFVSLQPVDIAIFGIENRLSKLDPPGADSTPAPTGQCASRPVYPLRLFGVGSIPWDVHHGTSLFQGAACDALHRREKVQPTSPTFRELSARLRGNQLRVFLP